VNHYNYWLLLIVPTTHLLEECMHQVICTNNTVHIVLEYLDNMRQLFGSWLGTTLVGLVGNSPPGSFKIGGYWPDLYPQWDDTYCHHHRQSCSPLPQRIQKDAPQPAPPRTNHHCPAPDFCMAVTWLSNPADLCQP
jgi:hypothetical protein